MKIAVTVSDCVQVGMDQYRDINRTKVFDSSQSIDEMIKWSQSVGKHHDFNSLKFSVVEE